MKHTSFPMILASALFLSAPPAPAHDGTLRPEYKSHKLYPVVHYQVKSFPKRRSCTQLEIMAITVSRLGKSPFTRDQCGTKTLTHVRGKATP
ncbi:MAG: hypothetical protein QNJ44_21660 [Rhodobacter sp.]|nr:hypothetical protein [Rhodobacter sp.]